MKKLISFLLLLNSVFVGSVYATDVNVKGGVAAVEIYYQNTEANKEVFQDVGVKARVYLHDECKESIAVADCKIVREKCLSIFLAGVF